MSKGNSSNHTEQRSFQLPLILGFITISTAYFSLKYSDNLASSCSHFYNLLCFLILVNNTLLYLFKDLIDDAALDDYL
jgi:hypothetical protein